jgi:hypothetical protein
MLARRSSLDESHYSMADGRDCCVQHFGWISPSKHHKPTTTGSNKHRRLPVLGHHGTQENFQQSQERTWCPSVSTIVCFRYHELTRYRMVWIHGGGYTLGSKLEFSPSAAGLILESQRDGSEGIIWVGINYRLGIFVSSSVVQAMPEVHRLMNQSGLSFWTNVR